MNTNNLHQRREMMMMTINEQMNEYNRKRRELDNRVLAGLEQPPICFTCETLSKTRGTEAWRATYITTGITPAGYRAYKCDEHVPKTPQPLWGSDPGWQVEYTRIDHEQRKRARA